MNMLVTGGSGSNAPRSAKRIGLLAGTYVGAVPSLRRHSPEVLTTRPPLML